MRRARKLRPRRKRHVKPHRKAILVVSMAALFLMSACGFAEITFGHVLVAVLADVLPALFGGEA